MFFTKLESRMKHRIYTSLIRILPVLCALALPVDVFGAFGAGTNGLDLQVAGLNAAIERAVAAYNNLQAAITNAPEETGRLQSALAAVQDAISTANSEKRQLDQTLRQVETNVATQVQTFNSSVRNISSQISTAAQDGIERAETLLQGQRETATQALQKLQDNVTAIQTTVNNQLQGKVTEFQARLDEGETRLGELVGRAEGAAVQAADTETRAKNALAQARTIKTQVEQTGARTVTTLETTAQAQLGELRAAGAKAIDDCRTTGEQILEDCRKVKETLAKDTLAEAFKEGFAKAEEIRRETNKDVFKHDEEMFEKQRVLQQETLNKQEEMQKQNHKHVEKTQQLDLEAKKEWWENTWPKIQSGLGTAFSQSMDFISDKGKMTKLGIGVGAIAACVLTAKYGTNIAAEVARKYIMTPNLVTDTSIRPFWYRALFGNQELSSDFDELILAPQIKSQIINIANGARKITHSREQFANVNYQNVCLYGPPGTGKTMAAKLLAGYADMDYAYINAGDVAKLSTAEAIMQLQRLFKWAKNAPRGLLLFIDEAEGFLCDRKDASEHLKLVIEEFISETGTSSKEFMVVIATNHPTSLDSAVRSRLEQFILFDYPGEKEREQLITQYLTKFSLGEDDSSSAYLDQQLDIALAVQKTKDFAGRDIEKMANDIIVQAHLNHNSVVSNSLLQTVVDTWVNMLPIKRKMEGQGGHLANAHAQHVPQQHGHQQLVPAV